MADADTAIYLVEQGRTQVGELGGGNGRFRIQAVVGEELGQIQALDEERNIKQHETGRKANMVHSKFCII